MIAGKIIIAMLGLLLPGYAVARLLRLQYSGFAAFPFSALIICQSITAVAICGGRITFPVIATALASITALCGLTVMLRKNAEVPPIFAGYGSDISSVAWLKPALVFAVLLLIATAFRTALYPLGGFDTFIRWNALAKEMIQYGSLSFYPPVTAADFSIYTMPDGFPPLVASVYWWIYAATGSTLPHLTALSVTLQLASLLGLAWCAAETAFGTRAASFTLLTLIAAPLLIRAVEIGQESGFLAIAVAGQLCFALAATRKPSPAPVYATALFAALGALAREYGPALALPGFLILFSHPETRSLAWRYVLLVVIAAAPWYIRNWLITGSPFYPFMLPGAHNENRLLGVLLNYYGDIFGIDRFGVTEWLEIVYELALGGSVALLAGLSSLAVKGRRLYPYTLSLLLITLLWLWSIGKTSGGVIYSMRVLAPAVIILALVAGKTLADIPGRGWMRFIPWFLIPASLWGVLSALSFPQTVMQLPVSLYSTKGEAPEFCEANKSFANRIENLDIPATGILTDSPYFAVILKRETRFRPVVIWSSEVSAIITPEKSFAETSGQLLDKGITMVALNRSSIHNNLLFSTPFYRDGVNEWQVLCQLDDWTLFAITPGRPR